MAANKPTIYKFRLAISLANLQGGGWTFLNLCIPVPSFFHFADHTVRRSASRGGQSRLGYSYYEMTWDFNLLPEAAKAIRDLITEAETTSGVGNGTLYFTAPRTDAVSSGLMYIDGHGIAQMPDFSTPPKEAGGLAYQGIILRINNVTIDNQPAVFP